MELYDQKLHSLQIEYQEIDIKTSFGRTRVIKTGNTTGKNVVLFHEINAGAPTTLEVVQPLLDTFQFYAIDTIGQTTKSAPNRLNSKNKDYAIWALEVLEGLNIENAHCIGISYGAYILQKLIQLDHSKINSCVFVVPSGIVSGDPWISTKKLTLPLIKWKLTKKEDDLKQFLSGFAPIEDAFTYELLHQIMVGTYLDISIPKLLKAKNVKDFKKPVFVIAASDDVYFPGEKVIRRAKVLFPNFRDALLLKNSKHMPSKEFHTTIQNKIKEWLG
ncbi:MAG: hypothetical protein NXI08_03840 [bacterium]|nr:hypothetical protein [bacterium]